MKLERQHKTGEQNDYWILTDPPEGDLIVMDVSKLMELYNLIKCELKDVGLI